MISIAAGIGVLASVLTSALSPAVASTDAGQSAGAVTAPCGQYYTKESAYYNHCGKTDVVVNIRWQNMNEIGFRWNEPTDAICLAPGSHYLGRNAESLTPPMGGRGVDASWSSGEVC
ncbi:DUF6355 family natural product biosynthesis protein [Kribbella sp. DT2]|uniref:DUF6355 family natural product biosynthesis protein n=1 Tax=Kribbella sp. DT2 TaxID=3393427 RepID=UPI003CFABD47